ncbi:MAG: hypothetical protein [Cressdnaviricota sp.]|nr:MAG: hypothetical protein [Cressdnaviricota sp.]
MVEVFSSPGNYLVRYQGNFTTTRSTTDTSSSITVLATRHRRLPATRPGIARCPSHNASTRSRNIHNGYKSDCYQDRIRLTFFTRPAFA